MANVILSTNPFDMSAWDLSDIADGTVTSHTATKFTVNNTFHYSIAGSGFTTFDANGFPTDGTITSITIETFSDHATTKITGISIAASDFMGFVDGSDTAGLENALFSGNDKLIGGTGNDVLLGLGGNDTFTMSQGGDDVVQGGDGDDSIAFKGAFNASDQVDGGAGSDKVTLAGDYSAGVTFGASTMVNVETLVLGAGNNYSLTLNATTDTGGQSLEVTASSLTAANHVTIDGSATSGALRLVGGNGNDTLIGGSGAFTVNGNAAGNDTITASSGVNTITDKQGQNTFIFSNWNSSDSIIGSGSDILQLNGDFSAGVTINGSKIQGVNSIQLQNGHSYDLTITDGDASFGGVGGAAVANAADSIMVDASAVTHAMTFHDGAGNDVIHGSSTAENFFEMGTGHVEDAGGGEDTFIGGSGEDVFYLGPQLDSGDVINGVSGNDQVDLSGNLAAPMVWNDTTIQNIALIQIGDVTSTSVNITTGDNVTAGHSMAVQDPDEYFSGGFFFNGAASAGNFTFDFRADMDCVITGGSGDDSFVLQSDTFNTSSQYDGGAGDDTITFNIGNNSDLYKIQLGAHTIENFENVVVPGKVAVTTADGNLAAGQVMHVSIQGGWFDGHHETDGTFVMTGTGHAIGGALDDTITLTATSSASFTGGGGADTLTAVDPSAHNVFIYNGVSDSTSTAYDIINDFYQPTDTFTLPTAVTGIDATVASGTLSTATFDADLAAAVGSAQLGANHAVVFTPDSGTLAGDTFMIVDANGTAGYQAGQDYVIEIPYGPLALTTANFTTS